jgi:Flp pilus assembly protein TadG
MMKRVLRLFSIDLRQKTGRSGQASIEFVMSLLLFVSMLGTLLSLSMYLYMHHTFLTAAKVGARTAAADSRLANANTYDDGVANVRSKVKSFVSSSTSVSLDDTDIEVDGPNGAQGDRTVTVTVSYDFENPVQIRTFINRLSGGSSEGLDTFTISDNATMRYEE